MPRGSYYLNSRDNSKSRLPSARKVSLELHHDGLYPLGDILSKADTLGSDPTCGPELRFGGCDSCFERDCKNISLPRTCEFNQPCPKDKTTAAKLGGDGALVTHMVRKISADKAHWARIRSGPLARIHVEDFGQNTHHANQGFAENIVTNRVSSIPLDVRRRTLYATLF